MALSRRSLIRSAAPELSQVAARVAARGREAASASAVPVAIEPPGPGEIRLSSNENPLGPGPRALAALRSATSQGHLYPDNADPSNDRLRAALVDHVGAESGGVLLGAGSGELLQKAVQCFCGPDRALVTAVPSYGQPVRVAEALGVEVRGVPVDHQGRLDLESMAVAARGAGLVFLCNPNNPTGTLQPADEIEALIGRLRIRSPGTVVHVDEAYHEYVDAPGYRSLSARAVVTPDLLVTRTFSKAYGMAGMRIGYGVGHPRTLERLGRYSLPINTSVPGQAAALAALADTGSVVAERARNTEVRALTVDFFEAAGYPVFESTTNFIFVDLGQPANSFRAACAEHGVRVGRDFPPYERTHCRISIGTREEMERAIGVFERLLGG